MEKDLVKKFTRFLKERNTYTSFINEFKEGKDIRLYWANNEVNGKTGIFKELPNGTFISYCRELAKPFEVLNFAFKWSETEKGYDFWNNLSSDWKEEMEMYFNKV